jgi:hypothetical protein
MHRTHTSVRYHRGVDQQACNGYMPPPVGIGDLVAGPLLGSWSRGYRYARDIMTQLGNGASGWVDWNLMLDRVGGPNHAQNNVDAPILLGRTLGATAGGDETPKGTSFSDGSSEPIYYYLQPMFFHIAHFSAFVPPGSQRVPCSLSSPSGECAWTQRSAMFQRLSTE